LVFVSVLLLALGTTGGAAMSVLESQIRAYATERIFDAREIHYLSGSGRRSMRFADGRPWVDSGWTSVPWVRLVRWWKPRAGRPLPAVASGG
jgi:hypothetical protein